MNTLTSRYWNCWIQWSAFTFYTFAQLQNFVWDTHKTVNGPILSRIVTPCSSWDTQDSLLLCTLAGRIWTSDCEMKFGESRVCTLIPSRSIRSLASSFKIFDNRSCARSDSLTTCLFSSVSVEIVHPQSISCMHCICLHDELRVSRARI